jgi:hypothetical protein
MFEEYQKRVLPALLKERIQKCLQSDSDSESQDIRQTKETIERIINRIFSEVMEDLFKQWHQPQEQQTSGVPALNDTQAPVSTSIPQFQPPRQGMAAFYVAPPSVQTSTSLSLSDLNTLSQGVQLPKPTSDSGYYSTGPSSYGQYQIFSAVGRSSIQSASSSQHHRFATPSSSRLSDRQATSTYVGRNVPHQLNSNHEKNFPMDLELESGKSQPNPGAMEQPEFYHIGSTSPWILEESATNFASSFPEPANGESKNLYFPMEPFDDQQIAPSSDLFREFPNMDDYDFTGDPLL